MAGIPVTFAISSFNCNTVGDVLTTVPKALEPAPDDEASGSFHVTTLLPGSLKATEIVIDVSDTAYVSVRKIR